MSGPHVRGSNSGGPTLAFQKARVRLLTLKFLRIRHNRQEGAAAVEFALLSSVLFVLIFGIIEFGQFYSQFVVFESAAREGARYAAVRDSSGAGPSTAEVAARIDQASTPYDRQGSVSVSPACTSATSGDPITVQWTQPFNITMPFVPPIDKDIEIRGVFRCE